MERLDAVPTEKIQTWCSWLIKTSEISLEWQEWLLLYIDWGLRVARGVPDDTCTEITENEENENDEECEVRAKFY